MRYLTISDVGMNSKTLKRYIDRAVKREIRNILHKDSVIDKLVFVLRKNIAELKDINARAVKGQIKNSKEFGKYTHDNYRQYGQTLLNNQREWFNSIDRYAQEIGNVDRDKRVKIADVIKKETLLYA